MVRRGWCVVTAAAVALLAGCSGDDDASGPSTTSMPTTAPPPTLPADVEPGTGALVLDGDLVSLTVTSCAFDPTTDAATGVTTELEMTATDATGETTVAVSRDSTVGDLPTVTDIVIVENAVSAYESRRIDRDGLLIDLREDNPVGRLIEVDGAVVRAAGRFGAPLAQAAPTDVDGELLLRCP